jgi:transposase
LHVTPANAGDRGEAGHLTRAVQIATSENVELAFTDQGYNGPNAASAAEANGIERIVVKPPEAKKGFVLLPRRWVVERTFTWATRFRRLVKDYERYPSTLAGFHRVAFVGLRLKRAAILAEGS